MDNVKTNECMESDIQLVRYEAGNPNFRGKTTIEINKDLNVTVSFEQNNHIETYSDSISEPEKKKIFEKVNAVKPCSEMKKKETTEPGDIAVYLYVEYPNNKCLCEFWGSDRFKYEPLNELIIKLNQLAATTSDGNITY